MSRTTGAQRTAARRRLKFCTDVNTANKRALALVRDGRFVGARGDGRPVDWTFCASGRYTVGESATDRFPSTGSRWRTTDATYKSTGTFTVVIEDRATGLSVGIARKGGQWQVGVARSFGDLENLGPVMRTAATTC